MLKALSKLLPDALLLVGAAGVSYGAWLAYQPLGYIVGGALAMTAALKLASIP